MPIICTRMRVMLQLALRMGNNGTKNSDANIIVNPKSKTLFPLNIITFHALYSGLHFIALYFAGLYFILDEVVVNRQELFYGTPIENFQNLPSKICQALGMTIFQ